MHLGLKRGPCAHDLIVGKRSPVPLKFQMAPIIRFIISSGSKKKEHRYACLSEAQAPHTYRMWTEVSSSVPHLLQVGLLLNPIKYTYLFRVLWAVRRPVTTLDCVLLKDSNWASVAKLGPKI